MKNFFIALTIIFSIVGGIIHAERGHAAPLKIKDTDVTQIRDVILGQIRAFRGDDAQKAFSYATPEIKRMFKTPKNFLDMVRRSYVSVYRPKNFKFRPIQMIGDSIVQPLAVIGPSGVQKIALYTMERQPNQSWKISGCIMAHGASEET